MKKLICLLLLIQTVLVYGQNSKRDSLRQASEVYQRNVFNAANQFLNKELSPNDRAKAIEPYILVYDDKQLEQFKEVALDNKESSEIRAIALSRIHKLVAGDATLLKMEIELLGNPEAPKVLRQEALRVAASISFSSMSVLDVYQKLLQDPDPQFRLFGFTQLIIHGDARAQQLLISGLGNPEAALLPAPTAIHVLSLSIKSEYYPAVFKLVNSKDEPTRLAAIRTIGSYVEARPTLIGVSRDPNEKEQFREAALGALYGGDRENIVTYTLPILSDKQATSRLQAIAIQMTLDVRQSMAYRSKAKKADEFDLAIKNILERRNALISDELLKVANKYIQSVKPNY